MPEKEMRNIADLTLHKSFKLQSRNINNFTHFSVNKNYVPQKKHPLYTNKMPASSSRCLPIINACKKLNNWRLTKA